MSGKPNPESVPSKIRAWFADNPDEELSYDDAAVKFGTAKYNVSIVIRQLVEEGLVELEYVRQTIARRKK